MRLTSRARIDLDGPAEELLVLGDELTTSGDPRGELIRLSLLAEGKPGGKHAARRNAWLAQHSEALEPAHSNEIVAQWRRGFIQELQLRAMNTRDAQALERTRLQLTQAIAHASCAHLHTVSLEVRGDQPEHFEAIAELLPEALPRLRCLSNLGRLEPTLPPAYNTVMIVNYFPNASYSFDYGAFTAWLKRPGELIIASEAPSLQGLMLEGVSTFRSLNSIGVAPGVLTKSFTNDLETLELVSRQELDIAPLLNRILNVGVRDLTFHCLSAKQLKVLLSTLQDQRGALERLSLPCAMLTDQSARAFIDARALFANVALELPAAFVKDELEALKNAIPSLTILPKHIWHDWSEAPDDEKLFRG